MNDRSSMSNDNSSSSSVSGTSAGGTEAVEPGVTTSNSATSNPNTTTTTERTYHSESATTTPDTAAADTGTQNDMNEKPAIKSGSHWRHHHAAKKMDKSTSSAMTDMPADQQLSQYSFDQKSQFKDTLKSRLDTIENKIQDVKSNEKPVISSNANHDKTMHSQVVTLQKKHDLAQKKLDDIDRVSSNDWDKYRNQISSQIGDLERNVEKLQTASR